MVDPLTLPTLPPLLVASPNAIAGPSRTGLNATESSTTAPTSSSFHSSAISLQSRRKLNARRKKAKVLSLRADRARSDVSSRIDPVLGDIKAATYGFSRPNTRSKEAQDGSAAGTKYEESLLKKVVLERNQIWYSPPTTFPTSEEIAVAASSSEDGETGGAFPLSSRPEHFAQRLTSQSDFDLVFKDLPSLSTQAELHALWGQNPSEVSEEKRRMLSQDQEQEQIRQAENSEQLMRILDLRNADSRGIRVANTRRIVEVFGGPVVPKDGSTVNNPERLDTGSSEVQAAILTHRIRLLADHLATNTHDVHNRKSLRTLVHQRAAILKYMRKRAMKRDARARQGAGTAEGEGKQMAQYLAFLDSIGLDRRAVEGEVIVR